MVDLFSHHCLLLAMSSLCWSKRYSIRKRNCHLFTCFVYLSKAEVIAERRELWHHQWRHLLRLRLAFWKKPIGDRETFKLMLFCLGNGCSPPLISRWILLSQTWVPDKAEKRARQLDFVLNNAEAKRGTWFYFDVDHNKLLYLNGLPKQ